MGIFKKEQFSDNIAQRINQTELTERLRFEEGLSEIAECLLTAFENNENTLNTALDALVKTIKVDWAHICKKKGDENAPIRFECIVKSSSVENEPAPAMANPCQETLTRWYEQLVKGRKIDGPVVTFPPEDRAFFNLLEIQSVLMLPIRSGKRFYGFLSLEDKKTERRWRPEEIRMAETAALMMGAYIERQERETHLMETTAKAERANRMKSNFVTNITREIRTPLSGIIGFAEMIESVDSLAEARQHVDIILKEAMYLDDLVTGLLDHASLDADELAIVTAPVDLSDFLDDIARGAENTATQKGLTFGLERSGSLPTAIMADAHRLRQAIANLVSNGIKFTQTGSVRLKTAALSQKDRRVRLRFEIIDTGIGIAPSMQQKIFESFRQNDESITREFGGTGLGITIAKRLVRLMGGEIHLESIPERGSRFWFDLSFDIASETPVAEPSPQEIASTIETMRILVAEDHPTNQMIVRHNLEQYGHEVTIAENGLQVLEACAAKRFDLILMDVQMPKMNGIEAARRIRGSDTPNKDVPIVAATASSEKAVREACMAAGMNEVVTKPLLIARLVDTLKNLQHIADTESKEIKKGASSKTETGGHESPPIDYPALIDRLDGDRNFAKVLLDGFCGQTETLLEEMHTAFETQNLETMRQAAHTIKGGAMNIVAGGLQRAAKNMEETAKTRSGDIHPLMERVDAEYQRLKTYLADNH